MLAGYAFFPNGFCPLWLCIPLSGAGPPNRETGAGPPFFFWFHSAFGFFFSLLLRI
jgi:hypothetical protein